MTLWAKSIEMVAGVSEGSGQGTAGELVFF